MGGSGRLITLGTILIAAFLACGGSSVAQPSSQPNQSRIQAALENILNLVRPNQDGYAAVWDGNKYIQCGRTPERALRCEAGGSLMQPSLGRILTPARVERLAALGWKLDAAFGNYVRTFPAGVPLDQVAGALLQALTEGYDVDLANLEIQTAWVASRPCPPRNGPGQNLAGMINDAPAMRRTAVRACSYVAPADGSPSISASTSDELMGLYGARVIGEIQRLRVNINRRIFVIFDGGIGYIQCTPDKVASSSSIYCEAQSIESWPALAAILTPERVARLRAAGYADPGRSPNFWRHYPLEQFDDAAIAREILSILHEVYGYTGNPALAVKTE